MPAGIFTRRTTGQTPFVTAAPPSPPETYGEQVLATSGLVSYWPLNDADEAVFADAVGSLDLTINGSVVFGRAALTEDPGDDTSVDFGGAAYAQRAHDAAWNLSEYTVAFSAVLRLLPAPGTHVAFFSKAGQVDGQFPVGEASVEAIHGASGPMLRSYIFDGSTVHWANGTRSGVAPLTRGRTHLIFITVHPTAGMRLYLDGALVGSAPGATAGWQANDRPITFFGWGPDGVANPNGLGQHLAVWNRALSEAEIGALNRRVTPVIVYPGPPITAAGNAAEQRADLLANDVHPSGATVAITRQPERGSATVDPATQEVVYSPPESGTGPFTIHGVIHPGAVPWTLDGAVIAAATSQSITLAQFGTSRTVVLAAGAVSRVVSQPNGFALRDHTNVQGGARCFARRAGKRSGNVGGLTIAAGGIPGTYTARVALAAGGEVDLNIVVAPDGIPSGARWVDPVNGKDDDNPGTQSKPWRSWEKAVTSVDANQTVVQTVVLRGGVYNVPTAGQANSPSLAANNVVFMAHPGDVAAGNRPRVWTEGAVLSRYHDELNAGHWQLHHAASNTWRTSATDVPNPKAWSGYYRAANGHWVRLMYYGRTSEFPNALNQLIETGSASITDPNTTKYQGPGFVVHTDGRIYIRFDPVPTGAMGGSKNPRNANPTWDWDTYLPPGGEKNPNNIRLIFGCTDTPSGTSGNFHARGVLTLNNRSNVEFRNIDFIGGGYHTVRSLNGGDGQRWLGCRWWNGACPHLILTTGDNYSNWANCVLYDTGRFDNLLFDRCEFWGGIAPWHTWWGLKGGTGIPERSCRATGFLTGVSGTTSLGQSFEIRHCLFSGFFALAQGDGNPGWTARTHHCLFFNNSIDGGLVTRRTDAPMYWIRNIGWNANFYSYHANVNPNGPWPNIGRIFEVYNLLTRTVPMMNEMAWAVNTNDHAPGWFIRGHELQHGWSGEIYGHPKKRAYCTMICGNNVQHQRRRGQACQITPNFETTITNIVHETWNNIYAAIPGPREWDSPSPTAQSNDSGVGCYPAATYRPWSGAALQNAMPIHDHNHLWRAPGMPNTGGINALAVVRAGTADSNDIPCNGVAAIRSASQANGGHMFEAHGTDGDPLWVGPVVYPEPYELGRFMLRPGSPCRTGAGNVTGRNWNSHLGGGVPPDFDGNDLVPLLHQPHRGAVDPDIPLIEQELGPL